MNYRIYLKTPEMKNYGAISISSGGIARTLIHAEMWTDIDIASKAFDGLIRINPKSWQWQLRDVKQKVIRQSGAITNE